MIVWIFVLAAVVLLERTRRAAISTNVDLHRYRLFALRDRLRSAVGTGQAHPSDWVFQYLDSSIAKTIMVLPRLNLWGLLGVVIAQHDDERTKAAIRQLRQELEKPERVFLREIHECYSAEVLAFFLDRHAGMKLVAFQTLWVVDLFLRAQKYIRDASELITESPESSTLGEFYKAQPG